MRFLDFTATLVVLARGPKGQQITTLALEHVAFDRRRRRVVSGCRNRSILEQVERWSGGTEPAAVMVNAWGEVCAFLDEWHATTPGLIENAFLQAQQAAMRGYLPASLS